MPTLFLWVNMQCYVQPHTAVPTCFTPRMKERDDNSAFIIAFIDRRRLCHEGFAGLHSVKDMKRISVDGGSSCCETRM